MSARAICSGCRIAIPDEWIPLEVHDARQVLRFCLECAPAVLAANRKVEAAPRAAAGERSQSTEEDP